MQCYGVAADGTRDLSESVRAALQVAHFRSVFVEATGLAVAARVPAAQLRRIITRANRASSETEALGVIAEERTSRINEIAAFASGFRAAQRNGWHVAIHVRGLLKHDVDELLDVAPELHEERFLRLRALQGLIDAAVQQARSKWDACATDTVESVPLANQGARRAEAQQT